MNEDAEFVTVYRGYIVAVYKAHTGYYVDVFQEENEEYGETVIADELDETIYSAVNKGKIRVDELKAREN